MKQRKRKSPFSIDFWMDKGYSYDDANYKRNSLRPIAKEYWLERGYALSDAEELAKRRKEDNNKKGALASASRSPSLLREASVRCPEHWIKLGFSPDQANAKVSEIQSTFSLQKCIEKYGLDEGTKIHRLRQERWQDTISSKSAQELSSMNSKKNCMVAKKDETIGDFISRLNTTRNMNLVLTPEEFLEHTKLHLKDYPYGVYYPIDHYIRIFVPKIQKKILADQNVDVRELLLTSNLFRDNELFFKRKGKRQAYNKWTDDGKLLRSSYEIYFYEEFVKKFPNRPISIGGPYPESNFRFDFLIDGVYIEIAPEMGKNVDYTKKMLMKKNLFGCILLTTINEIQDYIDTLT